MSTADGGELSWSSCDGFGGACWSCMCVCVSRCFAGCKPGCVLFGECACLCIYIYIYLFVYVCVCTHAYAYTYTHLHIHINIYIYVHIYTHTYIDCIFILYTRAVNSSKIKACFSTETQTDRLRSLLHSP
jgi:hypothetical protein